MSFCHTSKFLNDFANFKAANMFASHRQYCANLRTFLNFGKINHYLNRTIEAVEIITAFIELAKDCSQYVSFGSVQRPSEFAIDIFQMNHFAKNLSSGFSDQARHKPSCTATEID